jgi:cell division septation protein DedD
MAIRFQCQCGKVLMASDDQAGLEGQCPACERVITIPESGNLDMAGILDNEEQGQGISPVQPEEETLEEGGSESIKGLEELERGLEDKVGEQQPKWSSGRSSRFVMLTSIVVVFLVAVVVFMVVLRDREASQEPIIIKKMQILAETEEEGSALPVGAKLEESGTQALETQPPTPAGTEGESSEEGSTEPSVVAETEAAPEATKEEVVASIQPETPPAEKVAPVGAYTINLASFKQKEGAERYVDQLKEMGIDAFDWEVDLAQKGKWYRVSVGSFTSREEANEYAVELRKKGLSEIFITQVPGTS